MRCSRLIAITGALSLYLPLYAGITCKKYPESTSVVVVICIWITSIRPATSCLLCAVRNKFRSVLGPYRTGAWLRLAMPFAIEIQKKEIILFLGYRQVSIHRIWHEILPESHYKPFPFPVSALFRISLRPGVSGQTYPFTRRESQTHRYTP